MAARHKFLPRLGLVDPAGPVEWAHPLNTGLVHEWAAIPNPGWWGFRKLLDLTKSADGTFGVGTGTTTGNTWAATKDGIVVQFNDGGTGTSDSKIINVGTAGNPGGQKFTLAGVFNLPAPGANAAPVYGSDTSGVTWRQTTAGVMELLCSRVASIGTSTTALTAGKTQFAAVSYDGATARFYLEAAADGTGASAQTFTLNQTFYLGYEPGSTPIYLNNGSYLKSFLAYNRVLSGGEIAALWAEVNRGNPTRWRWLGRRRYFGVSAGGGGTTFPKSLSGSVTPAGSLTLRASKPLAGSITGAGSLAKQDQKPLAGSLTPSGTLAKQDQKPLAGSVAPTGALATLAVKTLAVAGSVTPAGAVTRQTDKALAGSTTPAGTVTKQAAKPLAGSTTPTGAVTKQTQKPLAGSTTPAGSVSVIRTAVQALAGAISAAGSLARAVLKALAGSVIGTGTLTTSGGSVAAPTPTRPPAYWNADTPAAYWNSDTPAAYWRDPDEG